MYNDVYSLYVSYPFLPDTAATAQDLQVLRNILDLRVWVNLAPADPVHTDTNLDDWKVVLTGISQDTAYVSFSSVSYDTVIDLDIPVYHVNDDPPAAAENYVIVRDTPEPYLFVENNFIPRIHPDCCTIHQIPPQLTITQRYNQDAHTGAAEIEDYICPDGCRLIFNEGHNTSVRFHNTYINFNVAPGAGLGKYTEFPWKGYQGKLLTPAGGLRSINGISGNVEILGGPGINVEVTDSIENNNNVVTVDIGIGADT